ncbi:inactive protein tyrosine kinase pTKL-like isoform X16 [Ruditapes philippinarum]|uniref:inactive protein tyrosine kinase pTKL-like isoform X16 n=1 Tax=Ruditapes philippinarum TaxID=129788 RepID=UPI00295AD2D5|nr:inactive protein tyrosine kinase pTKL-like isoform X16 [Ruditapes philippinarum]
MVGSSSSTLKSAKSESSEDVIAKPKERTRSENSVSDPIQINAPVTSKPRERTGSFESTKSYDEKRSRSLEDNENKEACLAMLEKHYCTIHLPIKDSHHSFSSLLYLNPEAFKDECRSQLEAKKRPQSCYYFSNAFDGFNMVPSLKPLETLHNNLTMRDLDVFLSRATTTKFFTPVSSPMYGPTPLASPRCPELKKAKSHSGPSLPSSSNSSAGPSSPTSASTPVDFINKLRSYIIDSTKNEQQALADHEAEADPSQQSSTYQKQDSIDITLNQPTKLGVTSESKQTDSLQTSPKSDCIPAGNSSSLAPSGKTGHQSAFKTVNRSNSQKSVFYVSQVSEESLEKKNSAEQTSDNEKKSVEGKSDEGSEDKS